MVLSFIFIPLLMVLLLNLPMFAFKQRIAFWLTCAVILAQGILTVFYPALFSFRTARFFEPFLNLHFLVDSLSVVMFFAISVVALSALLIAQDTLADKKKRFYFFNLLLIIVSGMNGIVLVRDLFTLYLFIEVVAACSFILIILNNESHALEGALKYIVLSAVATTMMLSALGLLLFTSGDVSFSVVQDALLHRPAQHTMMLLAMVLFVAGLFIKAGVVPFHAWVPDAYVSAPSCVSVLLAGIVTKVSGVYTLMRIMISVFGVQRYIGDVLMLVGAVSIVGAALIALRQTDLKRMLSFSSISQVGYIILSIGIATPLGMAAAAFHLLNHALLKSLLFSNAAAVLSRLKTTDMNKMGGLSVRMPVTGIASTVGFLSLAGIPPLSGFWSKLLIIIALWSSGHVVYASIAIMASALTLAYFLLLQRKVFFGKLVEGAEYITEATSGLVIPQVILSISTIAIGLGFPWVLTRFILPIQNIVGR